MRKPLIENEYLIAGKGISCYFFSQFLIPINSFIQNVISNIVHSEERKKIGSWFTTNKFAGYIHRDFVQSRG